ncbi:MAG: T9SS type A sorting domain-containing protein [Syntrophaceae bacterium]|nr:T9SS type A sorting domain-containing protein [Syntrophaceae bacterium]
MKKLLLFILILYSGQVYSSLIIYQPFSGSTTPTGWQVKGTDSDGDKDNTDFYGGGQGFLRLTKEATNEVATAFYTTSSISNMNWTLEAEVRITASSEAQDGEGITFCWVSKSLVDAQYTADSNYDFLVGALGADQGAPTNLNLLGFEYDHLYNPGDAFSNEYTHVIQIQTTTLVHLANGAKDFSNLGPTPNTQYYLNNGWIKFKLVCWQDGSDYKLKFYWTKAADGGDYADIRSWEYNFTENGISYPLFNAYFGITAATNTNKKSSHDIRNFILKNEVDFTLPVELGSFDAFTEKEGVRLTWNTESELDNMGYKLERQIHTDNPANNWQTIASYETHLELKGQGTTSAPSLYNFMDPNVQSGVVYMYRLSSVDIFGNSQIKGTITHEFRPVTATSILLHNAYPNPFNPSTLIEYLLNDSYNIELTIFDILGHPVRHLLKHHQQPGEYSIQWDGTNDLNQNMPNGTYFCRLTAGEFSSTIKLLLLK